SLQRTCKYASFLRMSDALHLCIFRQPPKRGFSDRLLGAGWRRPGRHGPSVLNNLGASDRFLHTPRKPLTKTFHSGFNVYCGNAIWPHNEEGLENVARYIIRAPFSQERMTYIPAHESSDGTAKVIYEPKDGKTKETFDTW
ncbi:MAG: transposase, partial [Deltaproteobacteria bacterium]|nr:transposase [Deltaproteobacteria bacterium]